jgi:hypothetical protein
MAFAVNSEAEIVLSRGPENLSAAAQMESKVDLRPMDRRSLERLLEARGSRMDPGKPDGHSPVRL